LDQHKYDDGGLEADSHNRKQENEGLLWLEYSLSERNQGLRGKHGLGQSPVFTLSRVDGEVRQTEKLGMHIDFDARTPHRPISYGLLESFWGWKHVIVSVEQKNAPQVFFRICGAANAPTGKRYHQDGDTPSRCETRVPVGDRKRKLRRTSDKIMSRPMYGVYASDHRLHRRRSNSPCGQSGHIYN
jgi:hypothetical protein